LIAPPPGGLESADLNAAERKGLNVLPGDLAARLPTGAVLSQSQEKVIEGSVFEGHFGYLPRAHLGPTITVKIARDLTLTATHRRCGRAFRR